MKATVLAAIRLFLKHAKIDYPRYLLMKPLFKLNGQILQGFTSLNDDQFFIYNVNGVHLPAQDLHWFSNYRAFEAWCDTTALHRYAVQPGDVVLDIGAGIGEEIIVLSKRVGTTGKVYAIEANPTVYNVLRQVKDLNGLDNTEVFNLAIGNANEEVELVSDRKGTLGGTIGKKSMEAAGGDSFLVKGYRLDTFLEEHQIQHIDLLKCNIEGAERFVVDSIGREHLAHIKCVAIACHDFRHAVDGNEFFRTKQYVSQFLLENGFDISSQNVGVGHIDDYVYGVNQNFLARGKR